MNLGRIALIAGVGALAAVGMARAEAPQTHVLTVELPNGQLEHIRYSGDVPPTVSVEPEFAPAPAAMLADPFVVLRRISADMDAQAAAMLRGMAAIPVPNGLTMPVPGDMTMPISGGQAMPLLGGLGPITVAAGPGVCVHSVQITYDGRGGSPHVVSRTSGDCGSAPQNAGPVSLPAAPTPIAPAVRTYQARYDAPAPYRALIHPVSSVTR